MEVTAPVRRLLHKKSLLPCVVGPRLTRILVASLSYCFSGFCLYFFFVPSIFCSGTSSSLHLRTFQGMNECDALMKYHLFHKDFSDSFRVRKLLIGSFCSYLWNPHTVSLKRTWPISCLWASELQGVKSFTCLLLHALIMMVCKTSHIVFVLVYFILFFPFHSEFFSGSCLYNFGQNLFSRS